MVSVYVMYAQELQERFLIGISHIARGFGNLG